MSEISRVCDHLTCIGATAMELGAFTAFLYMIKAREYLWELVEDVTGARLTISYGRVGDRRVGIGAATSEETIAYAITGPMLRAVGVPYDVRRARPYDVYDRLEWVIPTQQDGDNYARYLVRIAEMEQSMRIVEQALAMIPGGPINVDDEGLAS